MVFKDFVLWYMCLREGVDDVNVDVDAMVLMI
jgi:hypothetical protein